MCKDRSKVIVKFKVPEGRKVYHALKLKTHNLYTFRTAGTCYCEYRTFSHTHPEHLISTLPSYPENPIIL